MKGRGRNLSTLRLSRERRKVAVPILREVIPFLSLGSVQRPRRSFFPQRIRETVEDWFNYKTRVCSMARSSFLRRFVSTVGDIKVTNVAVPTTIPFTGEPFSTNGRPMNRKLRASLAESPIHYHHVPTVGTYLLNVKRSVILRAKNPSNLRLECNVLRSELRYARRENF